MDDYDYSYDGGSFDADTFYDYSSGDDDGGYSYSGSYGDNSDFSWGDAPGTGSSTVVNPSSGNITYTYDDGSTLTVGPDGLPVSNTESSGSGGNSVAVNRALAWTTRNLGGTAARVFQNMMKNPGATLLTALAAAKAFGGRDEVGGYNKPVPKMEAITNQIAYDDTNRRPGEAGRRYLTDRLFVAKGDEENKANAIAASQAQATGLAAAAPKYAAPAPNPYAGKLPTAWNPKTPATGEKPAAEQPAAGLPAVMTPEEYAKQGGIKMARGGIADAGRYLRGKTDGMSDEIETSIDGEQPALLSHGEFVIPADVVSHLGNGNSEAGAEKLYNMMDKIREARTGTKEQGKEINADKFLAAASGGLAAAYAVGGEVKRFSNGGPSTPNPTPPTGGGTPQDVSRSSTLSPWVGDYVTNALGQGAALANAPYQAYQGPLTAGASDLQQQAFAGASELAAAGYQPGQFVGGFGATQAQQYMNPYLQASLDPQLRELQRQSDIQRNLDAGRLTKAGAFGGARQAIMESEGRRNLLDKQADLLGTGYKTAFDTGMSQYQKDREAEEASRKFGAEFGMKSIEQLSDLGEKQRGITAEGIAADKKAFEEERDFAYNMPKYKLGLLSGLPIGANTTSVDQDTLSKINERISGLSSLYETLSNLGQGKK